MTTHRPGRSAPLLLGLSTLLGCTGSPAETTPPPPSGAPLETPAVVEGAGLAVLGYLDNLAVRVERGEWEMDEGVERSLRVLLGAAPQESVLLSRPVASTDLTGIIESGRELLASEPDSDRAGTIADLLELLVFSEQQLRDMTLDPAEPAPTAPPPEQRTGAPPTAGSTDVENPALESILPTFGSDCERFFRRFRLGEGTERCLVARTGAVGDTSYQVYAPAPSIAGFGWSEDHHVLLDEAVADALPVFLERGQMPAFDVVFGVNLDVPGEGATLMETDRCHVMLYPDAQRRDAAGFRQLVARQLGHCFQAATFPDQAGAPYLVRGWREDGLAEHLGNVVYPEANLEWQVIEGLAPIVDGTSILEWSGASTAWFQYEENQAGWEGIRSIVEALPDGGDRAEQAAALAGQRAIEGRFAAFGQAFVDGQIEDTGGDSLPTAYVPTLDEEEAAVGAAGPVEGGTLDPFALRRRLLVVRFDLQASLSVTAGSGVSVTARPLSGGDWLEVPAAFPADCRADNRLMIVAVSTAAAPAAVSMTIEGLEPSGC